MALKDAGHAVTVVTTAPGSGNERGVPVVRLEGVGGRFRRGRMVEIFRRSLSEKAGEADVIHAQHSLSALGALAVAPRPRVVVTVRDHWPVCFWSTRMSRGELCPGCSTAGMRRCIDGRLPLWTAPLAIPYMKRDLSGKQAGLRDADAIIAVSEAMASGLRASGIGGIQVIPNIINAVEINEVAATPPTFALPDRFVLFVGKLEANKGAEDLIPTMARSRTRLPLVILGNGSAERNIRAKAMDQAIEVHAPGWADRADVLRAMKRAEALVFPSTWPEPLSRVLLEALALGTPIAAMDTGGTSEIIEHGRSGLLARDVAELGDALGRIVHDSSLRAHLSAGAAIRAEAFSPRRLIPLYEALYRGSY